MVVSISLAYGIVPAWASILPILLRPLSIPQRVTGVIGVAAQIATAVGSVVFSLYDDSHLHLIPADITRSNSLAHLNALVNKCK